MLTVRMNWMDVERSCSADVQLSKDSKDIPVYLRNKLYHHRAQVASTIRQQLAAIKRELNGDDDEKQTEETKAAEALTALIKGQRYRDGKLYTCYMDGTSHEGCETVTAYNAYCRKRLDAVLADNKDITALVPDASEFDVSAIDSLVNEESDVAARSGANRFDEDLAAQRTDLHQKIDAARKAYNDKASKCARYLTSFVAIRNAKLSEGFDPSTVEHKATPAISPRLMGAADDSDAVVPAETDDSQQAAGASNSAEDVPEGNGEDAVEVKGAEDDEISLESDADEAAKAAENNAAMIEAAAGGDPLLRDGTVAMTQ